MASILKKFPYNSETQNCQMADPDVPKMIESDLTGQIRKKKINSLNTLISYHSVLSS